MPNNTEIIAADFVNDELPNVTWKLDFDRGVATTLITDIEATIQAALLTLNTERYEFIIFDHNYGIELLDLFGESQTYVMGEIKRRVIDALSQDDRITTVSNFRFEVKKHTLHVYFTISTIFGDVQGETEVQL